jgi:DMSO/TMAO reductase YedYZ heme-binding membrane subunit
MNKGKLFSNIRFYVLLFSVTLAATIFLYIQLNYTDGGVRIIKYTQTYALISVGFLYVTLLASPLTRFFTGLPFRGKYLKARRALGVSSFLFALLHAYYAFFGELGGFEGLPFLTTNYLIAISLNAISLFILALMASTAFDSMVARLTFPRWKMLHRLVYVVGVFTLIHASMLGSHFTDPFSVFYQISFVLVAILLIMESVRLDMYLSKKYPSLPKFGVVFLVIAMVIAGYLTLLFFSSEGVPSLGIHSAHIQLAKEAQNQNTNNSSIPSLSGDKTRRFSVSIDAPEGIKPNTDVPLNFEIFDASSGNKISLFSTLYEKPMHLIIVDSELKYFNHIHPVQDTKGFSITTQFPKEGQYHLYLNFQPLGAIEQQNGFTINVGNLEKSNTASFTPEGNLTKVFGDYEVKLSYPSPFLASALTLGGQKLNFTINDAKTHQGMTNLKPYLAAFGHLVMINQNSYEYLHVHPTNLVAPSSDSVSGPNVEFLPLGIYGPIKAGVYRVFAQFNPDGKLFLADFTVKVE